MVTFHLILLVTLDKCSWYIDKESATAHQVKTIRNTHLVNKLSLLICCSMEPGNGEVLVAFGLCGMILTETREVEANSGWNAVTHEVGGAQQLDVSVIFV